MMYFGIGCVVLLVSHAASFVPRIGLRTTSVHPSTWARWNNLRGDEPWFSNSVTIGGTATSGKSSEGGVFQKGLAKVTNQQKEPKLDFLEIDEPWYEFPSSVPVGGLFTNNAPYVGKIVSVTSIVGPKATGEVCHITIDHKGKMPYYEGQSYGIIPPGVDPQSRNRHKPRIYSIASTRYGDDSRGQTASLCVRRISYWDPDKGKEDMDKKGICSNYLCDAKPGDDVMLTGPIGKTLFLPESRNFNNDLIMVATGMGIAPYRSFIRRLFMERTSAAEAYRGQAWLLLGVANKDSLLYDNEWQMVKNRNPRQFRLDYALSREETTGHGEMIYFSGLKGMMPGILKVLENVAKHNGLVWEKTLAEWKTKGQWHVEVY